MNKKHFIYLIIFFLLNSCSNKDKSKTVDEILNSDLDSQMIEAYEEGFDALEIGDGYKAAKKFSEAEIFYPQSKWAPRSALMTAYSYYSVNLYTDTIAELDRYLKTYPLHNRHGYAYYLLALSYYEQIVDEKKDLGPLLEAKKYFDKILLDYPKSEFAYDSQYKLELIVEILAAKEMYLGRYYLEKEKWIPAINRFKTIISKYDKTIYIEEALFRLVEIHFKLGLMDESKKYAKLLGYNYQSSEWYLASYKIFNKDYKKKPKIIKPKKVSLINKLKSLID